VHLSPMHGSSTPAVTPGSASSGAGAGAGGSSGSVGADGAFDAGGGAASAHNLLLKRALVTLRCTLTLTIGACWYTAAVSGLHTRACCTRSFQELVAGMTDAYMR
jgi:hypothetical protein